MWSLVLIVIPEGAAQCQGGRRQLHTSTDGAGSLRPGGPALQEPGGPAVGVRTVSA